MKLTIDQVKQLQQDKSHGLRPIDWTGQPLLVDGDYGPKTQWWHYVTTLSEFRQRLMHRYLGYHAGGLKETTGANRDPLIDKMQELAGLNPPHGHAWCVMFVSWCLRQEGADWPVYHYHTGQMMAWAAKEGRITLDPKPGDIACFLYPPSPKRVPGSGHSEFASVILPNFTVDCGGNLGNQVRVGYRARSGLTFIDVEPSAPKPLYELPKGLTRLDGMVDR